MTVPAILSSVPDVNPYIQYVAAGGQKVYPYPFPITQDSDLVVVINGVTLPTDGGYTTSGVGNDMGGNITLTIGSTAGDIVTLFRDIPIERLSQFSQNGGFSSAAFNAEFNNLYLIAQQLETNIGLCLQVPNTNNPAPVVLLTPAAYAGKYLGFDGNGNPLPLSGPTVSTQTLVYPATAAEIAQSATIVNYLYPPGYVDRYGVNTTPGVTDMTGACTVCIACNDQFILLPGTVYAVSTINFPLNGPHYINFNGSWIRGISLTAQNCVIQFQTEGATVVDWRVDGNFSQNYLCGTWWYNATNSSQYNTFMSMKHRYFGGVQTSSGTTVRAMIYGALVGQTSTSQAQSENQISGWRTRGCQNPFYSNHQNGVLHFVDPIFVALNEEWSGTFSFSAARCLEVVRGIVNVKGGEIQFGSGGGTYSAQLSQTFLDNVIIETACPILIAGDFVRVQGGRYLQDALVADFVIASGTTGSIQFSDTYFNRPYGIGAFDNNPIVDASLAGVLTFTTGLSSTATTGTLNATWTQNTGTYNVTFSDGEVRAVALTQGATTATWSGGLSSNVTANATTPYEVIFSDTESYEWRWALAAADVRLVKNSPSSYARFKNHVMQITGSDPNKYTINSHPNKSFFDSITFDRYGQSLLGWALFQDAGGGTALTVTTNAGPTGFSATQFQLNAPSGSQTAAAGYYVTGTGAGVTTPPTLANQKANLRAVAPGDLYYMSVWAQIVSHAVSESINVRFYGLTGSVISDVTLCDSNTIPVGSWKYMDVPFSVPAGAAYMFVGAKCVSNGGTASTLLWTALDVQRAA